MRLFIFLVMVLGPMVSMQLKNPPAGSHQSQSSTSNVTGKDSTKDYQTAMQRAINSDKFVLSDNNKEYKLEHPVEPSAVSDRKIAVDYQVGLFKHKPAYATMVFDGADTPKDSKKADELLNVLRNGIKQSHPEVQSCSKDRKCVKWDEQGRCVRWSCG